MRDIISADAEEPDAVEEDARRREGPSLLPDVARGQDVVDLCVRRVWVRGGGDDVCVYVLLSEASCDACECSVNRAIGYASA